MQPTVAEEAVAIEEVADNAPLGKIADEASNQSSEDSVISDTGKTDGDVAPQGFAGTDLSPLLRKQTTASSASSDGSRTTYAFEIGITFLLIILLLLNVSRRESRGMKRKGGE